jgi:hypothetical protein
MLAFFWKFFSINVPRYIIHKYVNTYRRNEFHSYRIRILRPLIVVDRLSTLTLDFRNTSSEPIQ